MLEKLRAGIGAAGVAAILAELFSSSNFFVRAFGLSTSGEIGIALSLVVACIAFVASAFLSDPGGDDKGATNRE